MAIVWHCNCIALRCTCHALLLQCNTMQLLCCTAPHAPRRTASHRSTLHRRVVRYGVVLCCVVLCCIMLCHVVACHVALYRIASKTSDMVHAHASEKLPIARAISTANLSTAEHVARRRRGRTDGSVCLVRLAHGVQLPQSNIDALLLSLHQCNMSAGGNNKPVKEGCKADEP